METQKTITLDKDKKRATKVVGADTIERDPNLKVVDFQVFTEKNALASGCPAYIIIGGNKYKI